MPVGALGICRLNICFGVDFCLSEDCSLGLGLVMAYSSIEPKDSEQGDTDACQHTHGADIGILIAPSASVATLKLLVLLKIVHRSASAVRSAFCRRSITLGTIIRSPHMKGHAIYRAGRQIRDGQRLRVAMLDVDLSVQFLALLWVFIVVNTLNNRLSSIDSFVLPMLAVVMNRSLGDQMHLP